MDNISSVKNYITELFESLSWDLTIDKSKLSQRVMDGLYLNITMEEIDSLAERVSASLITHHYDYDTVAVRILISNLHKKTSSDFGDVINTLFYQDTPQISENHYKIITENINQINDMFNYNRDYNFTYFGYKTLEMSYLMRVNNKIVERPQHMFMRVSVAINGRDLYKIKETYDLLSEKYYTHATPTLINSCTPKQQLASCYLLNLENDNIESIYDTLKNCALISNSMGGIGLAVHCIKSTDCSGISGSLIPIVRLFNSSARLVDQGGKRPGAIAIYLEPWHADILEFLNLKKNIGNDEMRARDLFYGLWIPDLFMRRVKNNEIWSLMCPNQCQNLSDVWGDEFEKLYVKYEQEEKYLDQINARELFMKIIDAQIETGLPYMVYKDSVNRKSNQINLGTIKCSNLCSEIVEFTSNNEIAVCNLASIAVNMFIKSDNKTFDFEKLKNVTKIVTNNLNKLIDVNFYTIPEAKYSNLKNRPIGIGIQGLADLFMTMKIPYGGEESIELNKKIFETLYYASLEASCDLARRDGVYESYNNCPVSKGLLQYDLWNKTPSPLFDWDKLKKDISMYGVRNSLLIAQMPTASTSQILGNNESFEPITSNIYIRQVLSGQFQVINRYLIKDLIQVGIWNETMRQEIIRNNGSIQTINSIPDNLKQCYRTVWEIPQKVIINMAVDRGPFIDQSQSLNIFMAYPTHEKLCSLHFYTWKTGLKTGMYYFRTKSAAQAFQITINSPDSCLSCTS